VGHRTEVHTLVSQFALLEPSGFRRHAGVRQDELPRLTMPILLLWGDHEPLGSVKVAQAVTGLNPDTSLKVLPGGHVPWLGHPRHTADAIIDFLAKSGPSA